MPVRVVCLFSWFFALIFVLSVFLLACYFVHKKYPHHKEGLMLSRAPPVIACVHQQLFEHGLGEDVATAGQRQQQVLVDDPALPVEERGGAE